jgi:hypothetical protein
MRRKTVAERNKSNNGSAHDLSKIVRQQGLGRAECGCRPFHMTIAFGRDSERGF